jgi:glycosyltransferase involved in cell wall biosynthesis
MKITIVGLTYPFRGGISHHTSLLFHALEKRHTVELVSLRKQYPGLLFPGKDQKDKSRHPIEAKNHALIYPLAPWSWVSAFYHIRRTAPDLTLFQWWHPFFAPAFGSIAILLKKWGKTQICFLCHNVRPHESSFIDTLLLRYAFLAPDRFIVHSESDLESLNELRSDARAIKTPHPIYDVFHRDETLTPEKAKESLGIQGAVLLFFGYIRKYKGLEYLLGAFPKVLRQMECTLLIVGEIYEERERYLAMIDGSDAKARIRLIDRYIPNEEVAVYFNAADLVVLPYISATQSGVIQMAYGFNRPVVSTRVGGIPEAVLDGETGFLADPQDAEGLATAILTFFKARKTTDFSLNIERVKDRFSWERMVEVIEKLHESGSVTPSVSKHPVAAERL